jgi:hypothetical protein
VGTLALGLGLFFGLDALGVKSSLEDACPSYPHACPSANRSDIDELEARADRLATASTVSLIVGAVLVGGAAYLLFADSEPAHARERKDTSHR